MNKFNILLMGAMVLALGACSSDDNGNIPDGPITGSGTSAMMKINIQSTDPGSRADNSGNNEGQYDWDNADEHAVKTGDFFFFNAAGIYVTQANVWKDGQDQTAGPDNNIEHIGENVLVLKGFTEQNVPKYLVTVLNAPAELAKSMVVGVTTLNNFQDALTNNYNYTMTNNNGKELFVMSTSTYRDASGNNVIGVTELKDDDLKQYDGKLTDAEIAAKVKDMKPVDVYVERLAAKYTMDKNSLKHTLKLTIAGEGNEQGGTDPVGETEVTITIDGFGIVNDAKESYLIKHLVEPQGTGSWSGGGWNKPEHFRSFWSKSLNYDATDATGLNTTVKVAEPISNTEFAAIYSNENTKAYKTLQGTENRVKANLITNVVFTATISLDGKVQPLVSFRGIYYKKEQFANYILKHIDETEGGLNFYLKTKEGTTTTETKPDGTVVEVIKGAEYTQISAANLKEERWSDELTNAHFRYVFNGGDNTNLYCKKADSELEDDDPAKYELITDGVSLLNQRLQTPFNDDNAPELFEDGKTYYTVPIEHLVANTGWVIDQDGQFGIVRNHWYNFSIDGIMRIGHGVFNPDNGTDGDVIETPEDPKTPEKWGMAAKVNILSWKIVRQNITL